MLQQGNRSPIHTTIFATPRHGVHRRRLRRVTLACLLTLLLIPAQFWALARAAAGVVHAAPPAERQLQPPNCTELITNGNFENIGSGWIIRSSLRPAEYDSSLAFEGQRSMRLGIVNLPNVLSVSSVEQTVTLPNNATSIVLSFRYYPLYDSAPGNDLQRVDLYNTFTTPEQFLGRVIGVQRNDRQWIFEQYDLTTYAGQQISVRFAVDNDGLAGRTAMYVDTVSILACDTTPTPTQPTPTHTPTGTYTPPVVTVTPTPIPGTITPVPGFNCPAGQTTADLIVDGGFEYGASWVIGQDPVPPRYTNEQMRSGNQSMLLGNPPHLGLANQVTYSSVRQLVTIPPNATQIQLRWAYLPQSQEPPSNNPGGGSADRQDVIALATNLEPIEILQRRRENIGAWQEGVRPLQAGFFRGRSIYVYFNVFNNGNGARTWMYLDNVQLLVCLPPVAVQPTVPLPQPVQPIATPYVQATPYIQALPPTTIPPGDQPNTQPNTLLASPTPTFLPFTPASPPSQAPPSQPATTQPLGVQVLPATATPTWIAPVETAAIERGVATVSTPNSLAQVPIQPTSTLAIPTEIPSATLVPVATLMLSETPAAIYTPIVVEGQDADVRQTVMGRMGTIVVMLLVLAVIGLLAVGIIQALRTNPS